MSGVGGNGAKCITQKRQTEAEPSFLWLPVLYCLANTLSRQRTNPADPANSSEIKSGVPSKH